MRRHPVLLSLAALAMITLVVGVALSADAPAKAKPTPGRYLVMASHTPEECMKALDDYDTSKALMKFDFGCESGDHTAYAMVTANSEADARAMLPESQRASAKVVMLHKFTPAELRSFHAKMAQH
jgi:hypothetical protein